MNHKELKHRWYLEHAELVKQRAIQWQKNNPDKVKQIQREMNVRQLTWTPTGKVIYIKTPRTGICQECGISGQTQYHHFAEYHEDDPLKDTVELCCSCHAKISVKNKQRDSKGKFI